MKAFKAREMSIYPQYKEIMKYVRTAASLGKTSAILPQTTPIYPEVAEILAKDGYNVKFVDRSNKAFSYNEISWHDAKEGVEGKITHIKEDD